MNIQSIISNGITSTPTSVTEDCTQYEINPNFEVCVADSMAKIVRFYETKNANQSTWSYATSGKSQEFPITLLFDIYTVEVVVKKQRAFVDSTQWNDVKLQKLEEYLIRAGETSEHVTICHITQTGKRNDRFLVEVVIMDDSNPRTVHLSMSTDSNDQLLFTFSERDSSFGQYYFVYNNGQFFQLLDAYTFLDKNNKPIISISHSLFNYSDLSVTSELEKINQFNEAFLIIMLDGKPQM